MRARWAWLLLSCLFFGALGDFCDSSLAESQADPFTHEVYDKGDDWTVTLFAKKVCDLNLFYKDDQKLIISRPVSNKSRYDFVYLTKSHNFAPGKDYTLELAFGEYVLSEKAMAAKPKGYTGVGALILNLDLLVDLARSGSFRMRIDGIDFGSFDISGQRQGFARMIDCMRDVDKAAVSDALENEPPKSDLASAKAEPRGEPAPQRPDEEREASPQAMRYDEGDNWYINIDKDARVCLMDLTLGKKEMFIHFRASSSGDPRYDLTFEENFPPAQKEYFYEIGGREGVFSSGTAKAMAYRGRGYYLVDGLPASFLKDVSLSDTLLVRFDAVTYGEYDVKGFRRGLGRFGDCVQEFGVGSAKAPGKPSNLYDNGDDWSVYLDKSERTCGITLQYGSKGLILRSNPPGARTPYYLALVRENWAPPEEEYEFELGNEKQMLLSVKAQTFKNETAGFALVNGLKEDFLYFLVHSKVLRVEAKGIPPERYDLSGFGRAFERFSDCLAEVRGKKSSSPPKVRRMN